MVNINWRGCENFKLEFFEQDNQQLNSNKILCYGHNGSRKSSISEALLKIKLEAGEGYFDQFKGVQLELVDDGVYKLENFTQKDQLSNINVFNEDFIQSNWVPYES